jgi:hypothetical protein
MSSLASEELESDLARKFLLIQQLQVNGFGTAMQGLAGNNKAPFQSVQLQF